MERIKTIVCGTTFGQFYCEAMNELKDEAEFCGILAAGSRRSAECAERYGVKMYTSAADLPGDIGLACVVTRSGVLGGNGTELAKELLGRGINVIQEQPVHYRDIEECAKLARKNGLFYRVGDLYKSLRNVSCFIEAARRITEVSAPVCMDIGCASQVSYPVFEIISEVLKSSRPFAVRAGENDKPYQYADTEIGGLPVRFTVQNQVNPDDPDNFMHYLFRLELITQHGRLRLDDVMGGVCWYNKMFVPVHGGNAAELRSGDVLSAMSCTELCKAAEKSFSRVFTEDWIPAIAEDIRSFISIIRASDNSSMNRYYTRTLAAARMWHSFTSETGFPALISSDTAPQPDTDSIMQQIKEKYSEK